MEQPQLPAPEPAEKIVEKTVYRDRPWIASLRQTGVYLGVGALCHAVVVGPRFDPGDLWSWGWLLAWPAALVVFVLLKWLLIAVGVIIGLCVIVLLGAFLWDRFDAFKLERTIRAARTAARRQTVESEGGPGRWRGRR